MATIINNPGEHVSDNSGVGMIIGVITALLAVGLVVLYFSKNPVEPQEQTPNNSQINIELPKASLSATPSVSSPEPTASPSRAN